MDTEQTNGTAPKLKTIGELYAILRADEDRKIRSRESYTGGSDFMRNRLIIRDKDKTVIDKSNVFDTLAALGRLIGFDKINEADICAKNRTYDYKLIRRVTKSAFYKHDTSGWYILANAPVTSVALALNELFNKLNARYIAAVVDR